MYGISRKIHEKFINRKMKKYTVPFPTDIPNPSLVVIGTPGVVNVGCLYASVKYIVTRKKSPTHLQQSQPALRYKLQMMKISK